MLQIVLLLNLLLWLLNCQTSLFCSRENNRRYWMSSTIRSETQHCKFAYRSWQFSRLSKCTFPYIFCQILSRGNIWSSSGWNCRDWFCWEPLGHAKCYSHQSLKSLRGLIRYPDLAGIVDTDVMENTVILNMSLLRCASQSKEIAEKTLTHTIILT